MFKLLVSAGAATPVPYRLEGQDEISIGRHLDNSIVVPHHTMSRFHGAFLSTNLGWVLEDRGSRNGIFLDGNQVSKVALEVGQMFELGSVRLQVLEDKTGLVSLVEDQPLEAGTQFRSVKDVEHMISQAIPDVKPGEKTLDEKGELELLRRHNRILSVVARVGKDLLNMQDLKTLLEKVVDLVDELLSPDRISLFLGEDAASLEPEVIRFKNKKADGKVRISKTIAHKAMSDRVAVLTSDAQTDPRFKMGESIMMMGIRSAMGTPLLAQDRVLGLLYVDRPVSTSVFGEFDLDILTALGNVASLAIEQARLNEQIRDEQAAKAKLERYHSPDVVKLILERGGNEEDDVLEREISVLFCDLVGFTSRTEHMEPRDVARMLNHYFDYMTDAVFAEGGTLDKYMGDALLAIFGAPMEQPDHANRAVRCALRMRDVLDKVNEDLELAGDPLRFRVGINSGRAVVGNVGSRKRLEYTVLGATVNVAQRLESQVAEANEIVIGERTHELLDAQIPRHSKGEFQPKGVSKPFIAHRVQHTKA